jgi:hypothetical protein
LREARVANLVETDSQLFRVDRDSEVTVVCVVILFEQQTAHLYCRILLEIVDPDSIIRFLRGMSLASLDDTIDVVASVATYDEWHVEFLSTEFYGSGVALIVMRMGREECMRINALVLADGVNLAKHI